MPRITEAVACPGFAGVRNGRPLAAYMFELSNPVDLEFVALVLQDIIHRGDWPVA